MSSARTREQTQRSQPLRQQFRRAIKLQHRFQRRERQFADTQRAFQRMLLDLRDQIAPPDDQARLRAAKQLVAAERDEVGAGFDGFAHGRLTRQTPLRQIDERAAAQIHRDRQDHAHAQAARVHRAPTSFVKPLIA